AGLQVAHLDPVEGLSLARLDVLVFEDRTGITVEHHFKTRLEFVGRIVGHRFPTYSLNGYIRNRADRWLLPDVACNARRMPLSPMRGKTPMIHGSLAPVESVNWQSLLAGSITDPQVLLSRLDLDPGLLGPARAASASF